MKKFTKTLSIVMLVAMCMSMFTVGAFAGAPGYVCGVDGCTGTVETAAIAETDATCKEKGHVEYYKCNTCDACFDSTGKHLSADDFYRTANVSDPAVHKNCNYVPAAAGANCKTTGNVEYYKCNDCGKYIVAGVVTDTLPAGAVGAHKAGEYVPEQTVTCTTDGRQDYYECVTCQTPVYSDGTAFTPAVYPALGHYYGDAAFCQRGCGSENPDKPQFHVTGEETQAYSNTGRFYYYMNYGHYTLSYIKVNGTKYDADTGAYTVRSSDGRITIFGSEIAAAIGSEVSVEVVFVAHDGSSCGGFYLYNETVNEGIKVDGYTQKGYTKGMIDTVTFKTNDPKHDNFKVYSVTKESYVPMEYGVDYTFESVYGGMYTFTFTKEFLNELPAGTYRVINKYDPKNPVFVGLIEIRNDGTTDGLQGVLAFSNGEKEFKYVSGSVVPDLVCELFLITNNLQYSTDGYSWKNVSVYDFYIRQSNGKNTSCAWIKTSFLDNLPASSNVYFKVVVPASERGKAVDAESNLIKIMTGDTLRAVDTDKHVINSSKSLKFVASTPVSGIKVGNIALKEDIDYVISKDSKTITLLADFLNARTAGSTYTLKAYTDDGDELSTTFKILTTAQASASPRTGDDSNIALWSALVLMSGAAMVAVLPRLKKEN